MAISLYIREACLNFLNYMLRNETTLSVCLMIRQVSNLINIDVDIEMGF